MCSSDQFPHISILDYSSLNLQVNNIKQYFVLLAFIHLFHELGSIAAPQVFCKTLEKHVSAPGIWSFFFNEENVDKSVQPRS